MHGKTPLRIVNTKAIIYHLIEQMKCTYIGAGHLFVCFHLKSTATNLTSVCVAYERIKKKYQEIIK